MNHKLLISSVSEKEWKRSDIFKSGEPTVNTSYHQSRVFVEVVKHLEEMFTLYIPRQKVGQDFFIIYFIKFCWFK